MAVATSAGVGARPSPASRSRSGSRSTQSSGITRHLGPGRIQAASDLVQQPSGDLAQRTAPGPSRRVAPLGGLQQTRLVGEDGVADPRRLRRPRSAGRAAASGRCGRPVPGRTPTASSVPEAFPPGGHPAQVVADQQQPCGGRRQRLQLVRRPGAGARRPRSLVAGGQRAQHRPYRLGRRADRISAPAHRQHLDPVHTGSWSPRSPRCPRAAASRGHRHPSSRSAPTSRSSPPPPGSRSTSALRWPDRAATNASPAANVEAPTPPEPPVTQIVRPEPAGRRLRSAIAPDSQRTLPGTTTTAAPSGIDHWYASGAVCGLGQQVHLRPPREPELGQRRRRGPRRSAAWRRCSSGSAGSPGRWSPPPPVRRRPPPTGHGRAARGRPYSPRSWGRRRGGGPCRECADATRRRYTLAEICGQRPAADPGLWTTSRENLTKVRE